MQTAGRKVCELGEHETRGGLLIQLCENMLESAAGREEGELGSTAMLQGMRRLAGCRGFEALLSTRTLDHFLVTPSSFQNAGCRDTSPGHGGSHPVFLHMDD